MRLVGCHINRSLIANASPRTLEHIAFEEARDVPGMALEVRDGI